MKYRLIVLDPVADEVAEAAVYYDSQQPGLGLALLDEWERALVKIQRAPEGYQKKVKNFRQALLDRFPYLIVFLIEDSTIFVNRFINVRRHPGKRYAKRKK